jgi:hypothetical protein
MVLQIYEIEKRSILKKCYTKQFLLNLFGIQCVQVIVCIGKDMKNAPEDRSHGKFPTIQQIRREHKLTSRVVAETADIEFSTEYLLEIGAFVEQADALKVLQALSMLTGERYTLENVGGLCVASPKMKEEQNPRYS